jgi:hypothetical protein
MEYFNFGTAPISTNPTYTPLSAFSTTIRPLTEGDQFEICPITANINVRYPQGTGTQGVDFIEFTLPLGRWSRIQGSPANIFVRSTGAATTVSIRKL